MKNEADEIKVLIVDDHPVFRRGMAQIIEGDPCLTIVAEAGNANEALALLETGCVDVAVVDIELPEVDGLDLAAQLLKRNPPVKVVLLTMHKSERIFNAALNLGVGAYILKDEAEAGIIAGIRAVARDGTYITPSLSAFLMKRGRRGVALRKQSPGVQTLTPMERSVLKLIAGNKTSREIAAELFISYRTVETHRANICTKLNLHGNHPLLQFALENKPALMDLPGARV